MPPGSSDAIAATVENDSSDATPSATTWISHDSGDSWHQLTAAASGNYVSGIDRGRYYRHGLLYGFGQWDTATLAFSVDDGVTWTPIPSAPSKLEQEGWQLDIDSSYPIPDYRGDYWWYRVLSKSGQAPMLEHSTDDGRTWTQVGAIGSEPMQSVLLATTPLLPDHLCAALQRFNQQGIGTGIVGQALLREHAKLDIDCPGIVALKPSKGVETAHFHPRV